MVGSSFAFAEEIYKIVDEDGNVTYSAEPPDGSQTAEKIEVQPPPSEEDTKAAQERLKKIREDADKAAQARAEAAKLEAERAADSTTVIVQPGVGSLPVPYPYYHYRGEHYRPPHHRPRPVPLPGKKIPRS